MVTDCVKWPHDYGSFFGKWLLVEIFCTIHFRKRNPILHSETLGQTIQEIKCPLFITNYSSQRRRKKKILKVWCHEKTIKKQNQPKLKSYGPALAKVVFPFLPQL